MVILGYLIVGLVALAAGFIAGKLYTEKALNAKDLEKQVEESQQQMEKYREDVASNIAVTQKLMSEMKANYDNIVEQMNHTTKLLEQPRVIDSNLQYFGNDATAQFLVDNPTPKDSKRHKDESIQAQPSDYTDGSSGLFDNSGKPKQVETSED